MGNEESDGGRSSERIEVQPKRIKERIETPPPKSMKLMKMRAGLILCYIAIGLVGLVSLMMIIYFFSATHSLKSLAQPLTQESLQIYKEARAAVVDDVLRVGNLFLGSVLLPILTLLLGYMFGSREDKSETNEGD